jgi:5-methylcytosine-specific restriction endonuclease McrA
MIAEPNINNAPDKKPNEAPAQQPPEAIQAPILRDAGPSFELPYLMEYTPEAMLAEIRRVAALVEYPVLSLRRFDRYGRVYSRTVINHFGSWRAALERAGLSHRYSGCHAGPRTAGRKSDDELLEEIRALAKAKGAGSLRTKDLEASEILSLSALRYRFGSIAKALAEAGVAQLCPTRRRTPAELHANLLALWRHYGRAPYMREVDQPPSAIHNGPYLRAYRTWKRALAAFVKRMKDDPLVKAGMAREAAAVETRRRNDRLREEDNRGIPLSLRFKVLQRDRFRCVACGASPVHDAGCKLQVDHIAPFSKGGRTEIGNLRTLCARCNLGKGARAEKEVHHRGAKARS